MNKGAVDHPDDQPGLAGHGGMYRLPRILIAHNRILTVGRHTAQLIAGIEVANGDGIASALKKPQFFRAETNDFL